MDTHNIDICPIEWYGYALKSVRDISRICEEEMRESNHMRDIETVSPEGTFCDTVQVPSNGGDMELI